MGCVRALGGMVAIAVPQAKPKTRSGAAKESSQLLHHLYLQKVPGSTPSPEMDSGVDAMNVTPDLLPVKG
jgi:hypothetical protein